MVETNAEMAAVLAEMHRRWFADHPSGQLATSCLIETADGARRIVVCPWGDAAEREVAIDLLRALMVKTKAVRYAVWSEVWLKRVTRTAAEGPPPLPKYGALAHDPEREEAVFTLVVSHGAPSVGIRQIINRAESGDVLSLGADDAMDAMVGGDLADLLPKRRVDVH